MALLSILRYPDERLHTVAEPVESVNGEIRRLIEDMAQTMYAAPGVGLAATQVDVHRQVIVIDVSETHDQLLVLVNPEILERRGESEFEEGCLSVPGIYDRVARSEWIKVRALDRDGQPFELETDGLLSVCIQHEMDHLLGKVFVEYLSRLKQTRILARIKKQEKLQRRAL
jgi:peptide deformylase